MKTPETVTRHVGNCQICEGDFKVNGGIMVHHGYERPGHGYIVGDCPGVHQVPYEVSCELIKRHIVGLKSWVKDQTEYLGKLQAGTVTELYVEDWKAEYQYGRRRPVIKLVAGTPEALEVDIRYGIKSRWENAVRSAIYHVEAGIEQAKHDIERCEKRVAAWKRVPIRTVEEMKAKEDASRAERKAIKDAARAARDAKRAATKAKQEQLAAKRQAIREEFESKFNALAATAASAHTPDLAEGHKRAARELLIETRKAKYSWLSWYDFRCEEAFVSLGLAEFTGGVNGFKRPCMRWLVSL